MVRCDLGLGQINAETCAATPSWECSCPRCAREPERTERFHCCDQHREQVATAHLYIRGTLPVWVPFDHQALEECDCPGCKSDIGCFRK